MTGKEKKEKIEMLERILGGEVVKDVSSEYLHRNFFDGKGADSEVFEQAIRVTKEKLEGKNFILLDICYYEGEGSDEFKGKETYTPFNLFVFKEDTSEFGTTIIAGKEVSKKFAELYKNRKASLPCRMRLIKVQVGKGKAWNITQSQ